MTMLLSALQCKHTWKGSLLSGLLMLSACGNATTPVSIHGVNYSDEEFEYILQDPVIADNRGGGESINRYAAGGTMCCYTLPDKWQTGMKIKIEYDLYFPKKPDGSLPKTSKHDLIDIPHYDKPGELWVIRDVRGGMSVVVSDMQPDHPKWPGNLKGWPVPSLAYQRERADIYIDTTKSYVKSFQELSDGMRDAPDNTAKEMWKFSEQYDHEAIAGYSGYQDKNYRKYLTDYLRTSLAEEKKKLTNLEAARP